MLQVTDLVCGYGDIIAVHGISLSLAQGQTMALVGPNGAGKTSFLMALAGHIQPQSGQITLDGRNINNLGAAQRCEEGIGLVPEGRRIFPDLSVMENLIVGGYSRPQR
ncbi:MAG: ATP-binding cassette domain-containing protein, partial [Alphaproteobacteria bacterium]